MVKHIILWRLKDTLTAEQISKIAADAKTHLEALKGKIEGLSDIRVITEKLPSSTADMMLLSSFTSAEALKGYSVNDNHRAVADTYVRPFVETRVCMDFEEYYRV